MRSEQIKYFLEAAETGSMLQVAEKNFLTQPAVSTAISKLEEELEVTLLNRSKQGIQLTEAGKIVQKNFLQVEEQIAQMKQQLQPYKKAFVDETEGLIEFCTTLELRNSLIMETMHQFYQRFPNCAFSIKEFDFLDIITAVQRGRSEFGVFCIVDDFLKNPQMQDKLKQEGLVVDKIGSDRLMIGVPQASPLAQKSSIPLRTILNHKVAIFNSFNETCWHDIFFKKYTDNPQLIRTNSSAFLMDLVQNRNHLMFCLNSKIMQSKQEKTSFYKLIPVKEAIKVTIGIVYKKDQPLQPLSQQFIALLKESLKTL